MHGIPDRMSGASSSLRLLGCHLATDFQPSFQNLTPQLLDLYAVWVVLKVALSGKQKLDSLPPKVTTSMATAALARETTTTLVTNLPAWHTMLAANTGLLAEPHDGNDTYGDQQSDMLDRGSDSQYPSWVGKSHERSSDKLGVW